MPGQDYEITDINVRTTRANGTPLVTKADKQFWAAELQVKDQPAVWISVLVFREDPSGWKGTTQRLNLTMRKRQISDDPDDLVEEPVFEHVPHKKNKTDVLDARLTMQTDIQAEMVGLLRSIDEKLEVLCDLVRGLSSR